MIAILGTLGRVLTGFILACFAAGLVQVLFVETPKELMALPASQAAAQARGTLELTLLTATHFAIFSAAFALIAAGIAEWLNLRGPGYWLAAGMGIALLGFTAQYASEISGQPSILNNYALQAYLTAGFFGGLVYWLVSGVRSGAGRAQDASPDAGEQAAARPRIVVDDEPASAVKKGSLAEKLALKRGSEAATTQAAQSVSSSAQAKAGPPVKPTAGEKAQPAQVEASKPRHEGAATAVPVTKTDASAKSGKDPAPQSEPAPKEAAAPAKPV